MSCYSTVPGCAWDVCQSSEMPGPGAPLKTLMPFFFFSFFTLFMYIGGCKNKERCRCNDIGTAGDAHDSDDLCAFFNELGRHGTGVFLCMGILSHMLTQGCYYARTARRWCLFFFLCSQCIPAFGEVKLLRHCFNLCFLLNLVSTVANAYTDVLVWKSACTVPL